MIFTKKKRCLDSWGATKQVLNRSLLDSIKQGTYTAESNLTVASDLLTVVWNEYENYGTAGTSLSNDDIIHAQKTLTLVLDRLGIALDVPWRDFSTFQTHWVHAGARGSWQARREILHDIFNPVQRELDRREALSDKAMLSTAISPHPALGWEIVDERITALRRRFAEARTSEDYSDVGNRAVSALEALAASVYDAQKYTPPGEEPLPYGKTKQRFGCYIDDKLTGPKNAALRKMVSGTVEFSQALKHGSTTTRTNAGLLGDSVILLANILRRLEEE